MEDRVADALYDLIARYIEAKNDVLRLQKQLNEATERCSVLWDMLGNFCNAVISKE